METVDIAEKIHYLLMQVIHFSAVVAIFIPPSSHKESILLLNCCTNVVLYYCCKFVVSVLVYCASGLHGIMGGWLCL